MVTFLHPASRSEKWLPSEFDRIPGTVGWLVPWSQEYPTFVRVFHPVTDYPRDALQWRQIADEGGIELRGDSQFTDLAANDSSAWACLGDMGFETLRRLTFELASLGEKRCVYALWDGEQWVSERSSIVDSSEEPNSTLSVDAAAWSRAPVLTAPSNRRYGLFWGELSGICKLQIVANGSARQLQPTIVWSDDHTLCIATDPDYDSTIIAGSASLCAQVLKADGIEALEVGASTRLALS